MNIGISNLDAKKGISATLIALFLLSAIAMAAMIAPATAATTGTVTVSSDKVYGNRVIQVTVNDADLTAADTPMPSVTVSKSLRINNNTLAQGTLLPMYQAVGGSWVGFIALDTANVATTVPASASAQDGTEPSGNGQYATGAGGIWAAAITKEPWNGTGTVMNQTQLWLAIAHVQSPGSSFTITYNDANPAASISATVSVAYTSGAVSLDRTTYPPSAVVYTYITDMDLNVDPTTKDTIVNGTANDQFYAGTTGTAQPTITANATETGPNTGEFKGTIQLGANAPGDVFNVTYTEVNPAKSRVAAVVVATNTGSVTLDKSDYVISDTATVTMTDPDVNTDSASKQDTGVNSDNVLDAKEVLVRSSSVAGAAGNTDLFLNLTETGVNTGIFTKTFTFSMAGALGKLNVTTGSIITAIYRDAATVTGVASNRTTTASFTTNTGSIALNADTYGSSSVATVTVTDADLNTNTAVPDTISRIAAPWVNVTSSTNSTGMCPLMVETGANTGIFTGTFTFSTAAGADGTSPTIQVTSGDTVYAKYYDLKSSAGTAYTATATAGFSTATNSGSIALDQTAYSVGNITATGAGEYIKVTVTDPDLNTKSTEIENYVPASGTTNTTNLQIYSGSTQQGNNMPVTLKETGANTGVFTGKIQLNATGMSSFVTRGMVAQVVYSDAASAAGTAATAIATAACISNTGALSLDKTTIGIGESLAITLTEPDANLDYALIETVAADLAPAVQTVGYVYVTSSTDSTGVSIALGETAIDSGVFTKTITFTDTQANAVAGSKLYTKKGDTITVLYKDRLNSQGVAASITKTAKITATTGTLELDKDVYSPYNRVIVTITDPDENSNPNAVDQITNTMVSLKTTSMTAASNPTANLDETGADTSIFVWKQTLSGPLGTGAAYDAAHGDGLAVTYKEDTDATGARNVVHSVYATLSYTTGTVEFDQANYALTDTATITVTDPDKNANAGVLDSFNIKAISSTDAGGINVGVMETGLSTGVFTTTCTFTTTTASTGGILRVTAGDTVTAKYTDTTADPADIAGWVSGQAKTKVVSATATAGAVAVEPTPITSTTPALQDQNGNAITEATTGTMVLLASDMSNTGTTDKAMLYIVQVKNAAGSVVSLSFISGTVPAGATYTFGMPWTPSDAGDFTVEVFAWTSWTDPTPLSAEVSTSTVTVS